MALKHFCKCFTLHVTTVLFSDLVLLVPIQQFLTVYFWLRCLTAAVKQMIKNQKQWQQQ